MLKKYLDILKDWARSNRAFLDDQMRSRRINKYQDLPFDQLYGHIHEEYDPCFVLSTGRCGTKLLTEILLKHPQVYAAHKPIPEISWHSQYAWENHKKEKDALRMTIDLARYEQIRDCFMLKEKYVETNNRITFFAYQLAELFPKAKFLHLIRKPIGFVKSGYSRNWYSGAKLYDEGRLVPSETQVPEWSSLPQEEKIAWLWNETNVFVRDFFETLPAERKLSIRAEEFFKDPAQTEKILDFIGLSPFSRSQIKSLIKKPVNKQPASKQKPLPEGTETRIAKWTTVLQDFYPPKSN